MNLNQNSRQTTGRGCWRVLVALPFLLVGGILAGVMFLVLAGAFLVTQGPSHEVDTIVILSGGNIERAKEAALTYQENKGSIVLLTRSRASDSTSKTGLPPYAYYGQLYQGGVPADSIVLTNAVSDSTLDEAHAVLETMQRLNKTSAVIVTDPYHTRRASIIFKDVFRGTDVDVTVRAARTHWFRSYNWFLSKRGWETAILEYTKLFAYWLGVGDA